MINSSWLFVRIIQYHSFQQIYILCFRRPLLDLYLHQRSTLRQLLGFPQAAPVEQPILSVPLLIENALQLALQVVVVRFLLESKCFYVV